MKTGTACPNDLARLIAVPGPGTCHASQGLQTPRRSSRPQAGFQTRPLELVLARPARHLAVHISHVLPSCLTRRGIFGPDGMPCAVLWNE